MDAEYYTTDGIGKIYLEPYEFFRQRGEYYYVSDIGTDDEEEFWVCDSSGSGVATISDKTDAKELCALLNYYESEISRLKKLSERDNNLMLEYRNKLKSIEKIGDVLHELSRY